MPEENTYNGSCFCGSVRFTVSGDPAAMGYCHCSDCRDWSAGPVNAFSLWGADALQVTEGAEHVATFNKTEKSLRKWCNKCGGHLFTEHPEMALTDVYAALLPGLDFTPALHAFYSEKMTSIADGLPKFADLPGDMGGSGDLLPD